MSQDGGQHRVIIIHVPLIVVPGAFQPPDDSGQAPELAAEHFVQAIGQAVHSGFVEIRVIELLTAGFYTEREHPPVKRKVIRK